MSNVFSGVCTVGKDAEVRYTPSGQAVLSVNVANNIGFGDKQKTIWIRAVVWGRRAEGELKNYLLKGQQVFISGELTVNEYDKNDGTRGYQIEVNANILDLVGKKSDNQSTPAPAPQAYQPPPQPAYQTPQQQYAGVQQAAAQTPHYAPTQTYYRQPPPPTVSNYAPQYQQPDDDIPF